MDETIICQYSRKGAGAVGGDTPRPSAAIPKAAVPKHVPLISSLSKVRA